MKPIHLPVWGLLLALALAPVPLKAQTATDTLVFDGDGRLLSSPPELIEPGTRLQIIVEASGPQFQQRVQTFLVSLEQAKSNLNGPKFYEWEPLFTAYGFTATDRDSLVRELNAWIGCFRHLLNGQVDSMPAASGRVNVLQFRNQIGFNGLFYLEYRSDTSGLASLAYDAPNRRFYLRDTLVLQGGALHLELHQRDLEKHFLELAYAGLPPFQLPPNMAMAEETRKAVEQTAETFNPTDAAVLHGAWDSLNQLLITHALRANNTLLFNLLWATQGLPTINVLRIGPYEAAEEYADKYSDSIAYYQALIELYAKFRDGSLADLAKAEYPAIQCSCIVELLGAKTVELDSNQALLKPLKPGDGDYSRLTERNKLLTKMIDTYNLLAAKCSCSDPALKHPYRPELTEIAGARLRLDQLNRELAEARADSAASARREAAKSGKKERWLAEASLFVSAPGKITWMRHHDFRAKLGLMTPLHELKSEYLSNQAVAILTHNVPKGAVVVMHEKVDSVAETTRLEEEVSAPLATILGVLTATAVDRRFLRPAPAITNGNYKETRKTLLMSLECLHRELDFDGSVPYVFPLDDSSRYHTEISKPQVGYQAPVQVSYALASGADSSSWYTYRRNRLRRVAPSVLLGASTVRQHEYSFANNQVRVSSNTGLTYAAGLQFYLAGINLRNPHVAFSGKGKAYDRQPGFGLSRIGLFAGVSLKHPSRDFYLAPEIEVVPGLGIAAGLNVFIQEAQRLNGTAVETFDYQPRYGFFASIAVTPAVFAQIFPQATAKLPFFNRTRGGRFNGRTTTSTNR